MRREGIVRTGKVIGLLLVAVGLLLAIQFILSSGRGEVAGLKDWALESLSEGEPVVGRYVFDDDAEVILIGTDPVAIDFIVVFVTVPGYQAPIELAVRFDRQLRDREVLIVRSLETPTVDRALEEGRIDTLTGATITTAAIERATLIAERYAAETLSVTQ